MITHLPKKKEKTPKKSKEKFIFEISKKMDIPEETVDKVIDFITRSTVSAFKTCDSIELSGLGTFRISQSKLKKKKASLLKAKENLELALTEELDPKTLATKKEKLSFIEPILKTVNQRIHEL